MNNKILLNEILNIKDLENTKIRFIIMSENNWNPIELFKQNNTKSLLEAQYWNYSKKSYKNGQITIGFVRLDKKDNLWLLLHVGKITKDLEISNGVGYEYETISDYEKYFGRLIIRFKNKSQNMVRKAKSVVSDCEVEQILPDIFNNDIFPGYEK